MMNENAYAVYRQGVVLFLEARVKAIPGQLHYHINAPQANIEQCLAVMLERGQVEQCGTEQDSPGLPGPASLLFEETALPGRARAD